MPWDPTWWGPVHLYHRDNHTNQKLQIAFPKNKWINKLILKKFLSTYAQISLKASKSIFLRFLSLRQKPTRRPDIGLCVWGPPAAKWQHAHTERGTSEPLCPFILPPRYFCWPVFNNPRCLSRSAFHSDLTPQVQRERASLTGKVTPLPCCCHPIITWVGPVMELHLRAATERESKKISKGSEAAPLSLLSFSESTQACCFRIADRPKEEEWRLNRTVNGNFQCREVHLRSRREKENVPRFKRRFRPTHHHIFTGGPPLPSR